MVAQRYEESYHLTVEDLAEPPLSAAERDEIELGFPSETSRSVVDDLSRRREEKRLAQERFVQGLQALRSFKLGANAVDVARREPGHDGYPELAAPEVAELSFSA